MTGLAIGSIKARDEISEVVVIVIVIKMLMFRLSVMNFQPHRVANAGSKMGPSQEEESCSSSSSSSGEDKTFMTRLLDTFVLVPTWLPQHVTYDVIVIIKTFCMSVRYNGEKFVSIRQAVVEKNTKVLCRQTNTDQQTNPSATPSPSARVIIQRSHIKMQAWCLTRPVLLRLGFITVMIMEVEH